MPERIRAIVTFCAVMLVTVGMVLGPANAAAMLSCDAGGQAASAHPQAHPDDRSRMTDQHHAETVSPDHRPGHCAGHACVLALPAGGPAPSAGFVGTRLTMEPLAAVLVPLASPEGLRRPPRA
ncbi:hypothetical protein [Salipiger sp.]|uniref:hypothetical protein n=1 Tax=Salipiger sp. TaxID=2078585 RepID=UPI003A97E736